MKTNKIWKISVFKINVANQQRSILQKLLKIEYKILFTKPTSNIMYLRIELTSNE